MKYDVLFDSEYAYRVATVVLACAESGMSEMLIPDIVHKAMIPQSSVRYWIDIFESCGFIETVRYGYRKNSICHESRHVIIHIPNKKNLNHLYAYMWIQQWELNFLAQLQKPRQHLRLVPKAA